MAIRRGRGIQIVDHHISLVEVGYLAARVAYVFRIDCVTARNVGRCRIVVIVLVRCVIMTHLIIDAAGNRLFTVGYVVRTRAIQIEELGIGVSTILDILDLYSSFCVDVTAVSAGMDRGVSICGALKVTVSHVQEIFGLSAGTFLDEYTNAIVGFPTVLAVVLVILCSVEVVRG